MFTKKHHIVRKIIIISTSFILGVLATVIAAATYDASIQNRAGSMLKSIKSNASTLPSSEKVAYYTLVHNNIQSLIQVLTGVDTNVMVEARNPITPNDANVLNQIAGNTGLGSGMSNTGIISTGNTNTGDTSAVKTTIKIIVKDSAWSCGNPDSNNFTTYSPSYATDGSIIVDVAYCSSKGNFIWNTCSNGRQNMTLLSSLTEGKILSCPATATGTTTTVVSSATATTPSCTGTAPTGNGVIKSTNLTSFGGGGIPSWDYIANTKGTDTDLGISCVWTCSPGYTKNGNSCTVSVATTNNATPTFGTCTSGSVIKYLEGNCIDQLNFDCVNGNYQFAPKAFPAPSMDQLVAKKLFTSPSTCQTNTTTTAVQTSVTQGTFWGSECSGVYPTPNVKWYCGGNPGSGWNDVGSGCYHQCISSPAQIRIQSNSAQEVTVTNIGDWVFDSVGNPTLSLNLTDTNPGTWNVGAGTMQASMDFISEGYFQNSGAKGGTTSAHMAIVLRNDGAKIAKDLPQNNRFIFGQGMVLGDVHLATPVSGSTPNPYYPSTQIETWFNGIGNGNYLLKYSYGDPTKLLQDYTNYHIIIDSIKAENGDTQVRYRIYRYAADGTTLILERDTGNMSDGNTWFDSTKTGFAIGEVFASKDKYWKFTFKNIVVKWGPVGIK